MNTGSDLARCFSFLAVRGVAFEGRTRGMNTAVIFQAPSGAYTMETFRPDGFQLESRDFDSIEAARESTDPEVR